jgi:2OG-Fe(II) oxygenase superfamily
MFLTVDDALDDATFAALHHQVSVSPLIGSSVLVGGFQATRGFGAAFRPHTTGVAAELRRRMPFMATVLALAHRLVPASFGTVGIVATLCGRLGNACYGNVLCIPAGSGVDRHVDATLFAARPGNAITPAVVAVLYVEVPATLSGGALRLWNGDEEAGEITAKPNRVVLFKGHLAHSVQATVGTGTRISVVIELYRLPWWQLHKVPPLRVQSDAFGDVMARLRASR